VCATLKVNHLQKLTQMTVRSSTNTFNPQFSLKCRVAGSLHRKPSLERLSLINFISRLKGPSSPSGIREVVDIRFSAVWAREVL
jgi:hypothetical protein